MIGLMFIIGVIAIMNMLSRGPGRMQEISYSEFLGRVQSGRVMSVVMSGETIRGQQIDGEIFSLVAPKDPSLVEMLQTNNVKITARPDPGSPWYVSLLLHWGPFILIIVLWIYFMRRMQGGGNRLFSLGKSKARRT
ncbi:MAG: ATP-dependent metallopeptidase FtsH/Yme1/Tma family protein, partial [Deltaproteobacteria bacterium]|nr:ATP-dependent metallopeptidase FtsH/Yme1/Tma family protein [Deltaproteobacteria bacterium]